MDASTVLGFLIILGVFQTMEASDSLVLYNTSMACLKGSEASSYMDIDCYDKDPNGLVLIRRVIHGLTPDSSNCRHSSPKNECCPEQVDPERECVFVSEEETEVVRRKCDGVLSCYPSLGRATVGDACPERAGNLVYDDTSYFAHVEYNCVSTDLTSNICDTNVMLTKEAVFVETNFVRSNKNHSDKTCSCVLATHCQHTLTFEVLEVDLNTDSTSGNCTETVVLTEGQSGDIIATLNCSTDESSALYRQDGGGMVFHSQSSVVSLDLQINGNSHPGKLVMSVTASGGTPVQVLCGQAGSGDVLNQTQCVTTTTTMAPTSLPPDVSSPTFNSSKEACLHGTGSSLLNYRFDFSCPASGSVGLISVEKIFHGVTPKSLGCDASAPEESCCPGYDPARDCLFSTDEGLKDLREKCDGAEECLPKLERATVNGACPDRVRDGANLTYDDYSTFAFVQYSCLNLGLMSDVCDAGNTIRGTEVFVETNIYHGNKEQANTNCSCVVTTRCDQRLLFYPLLLDLASITNNNGDDVCVEEVSLVDGRNSSVGVSLNCSANELEIKEGKAIFQSQTNIVNFQLHLRSNNEGKMWFKVVATNNAAVEVRCGRTTSLPVWEEHQCPSDITTTTSIPAAPTASTPATTPGTGDSTTAAGGNTTTEEKSNGDLTKDTTAIIIAAGVVAFLVVIAFIVIVVIICRSRKMRSQREALNDDDENSVYYDNLQETVEHVNGVSPYAISSTYDNVQRPLPAPAMRGSEPESEKNPYDSLVEVPPQVYMSGLSHNTDLEGAAGTTMNGAVGGIVNPSYSAVHADEIDNMLNMSKIDEGAKC